MEDLSLELSNLQEVQGPSELFRPHGRGTGWFLPSRRRRHRAGAR